jgi:hypothetical protein
MKKQNIGFNIAIYQLLLLLQSILVLGISTTRIARILDNLDDVVQYIALGVAILISIGFCVVIKILAKRRRQRLLIARVGIIITTIIVFIIELVLKINANEIFLTLCLLQLYLESLQTFNLDSINDGRGMGITPRSRVLITISMGCFLPYVGTMEYLKGNFILGLLICLVGLFFCTSFLEFLLARSPEYQQLKHQYVFDRKKLGHLKFFIMTLKRIVFTILVAVFFIGSVYLAWDPRRLNLPFLSYIIYYDAFLIASLIFYSFIIGWLIDYILGVLLKRKIWVNTIECLAFLTIFLLGLFIEVHNAFLME